MICYFLDFRMDDASAAKLAEADRHRLVELLRATPGLGKALIFTEARADDPYLNDGPCPPLALQLYFRTIDALQAAVAEGGHLETLADTLPSLTGAAITQQAMLARSFAVPDPVFRTAPGGLPCTYLVAYEGMAEDLNLWLSHYVAHHTPIMARFPGIREVEISTRIDWCSGIPWRRVEHMQRNKVVFDSADALNVALNSPVRHEMRADFAKFPPFMGRSTHHPMTTQTVMP